MQNCTYAHNGKSYAKKDMVDLLRDQPLQYYSLEFRPQDWITVEEAKTIVKAWLPNSTLEGEGSWLRILPQLIKNQINNPGNDILGRIANSAIELQQTDSGLVNKQVLTHEIIHLIHQYGLSPKWKQRLDKAFIQKYGEEFKKLNPENYQHFAALIYQKLEAPNKGLKSFVDMIKSLIDFFILNKKDIVTLGNLIRSGYFSKNVTHIEPEYEANYSFIKKYFGNIAAYEAAKAWVMSRFDYYSNPEPGKLQLTREEVIPKIRSEIQDQFILLNAALEEQDINVNNASIFLEEMKLEGDKEMIDFAQSDYQSALTLYNATNNKLYGLRILVDGVTDSGENPVVIRLFKDIFPNWSMSTDLVENIYNLFERPYNMETEEDAIVSAESIRNETQRREEEDVEMKTTTAVKDFLSFIKISNTADPYDIGNYIPYGWAFAKMSQIFHDYIDLHDINTEKLTSILEAMDMLPGGGNEGSWTYALVHKFKDLVLDVLHGPTGVDPRVAIRTYQDPYDNKIYYGAFIGDDSLADVSSAMLFKDSYKYTSKILAASHIDTGISKELYEYIKYKIPEFTVEQYNTLYRHTQAINTLNEIQQSLGSMNERDYFVAMSAFKQVNTEEGLKFVYSPKYISSSASTTDSLSSIRTDFENAFINLKMSVGKSHFITSVGDSESIFKYKKYLKTFIDDELGLGEAFKVEFLSDKDVKNLFQTIRTLVKNLPEVRTEDSMVQWTKITWASKFKHIANILNKENNNLRAGSILTSDNKRIYKFTVSSFGIKLLNLLHSTHSGVDTTGGKGTYKGGTRSQSFKDYLIPEFIYSPLAQLNIFVNGDQSIASAPILHESTYSPFTKKSWIFSRETDRLWWSRNYIFGFIEGLNSSPDNSPEYYQFFYQPSDAARIPAVKIKMLNKERSLKGIQQILKTLHHLKFNEGTNLKYTNLSFFKDNALVQELLQEEDNISNIHSLEKTASSVLESILAHASLVESNVYEPLKVKTPSYASVFGSLWDENSNISSFQLFYVNNYINSYFLNSLVLGNPEYFSKGSADIIKRASGLWGPQIKPRVGKYGTSPSFKTWVLKDSNVAAQDDSVNEYDPKQRNRETIKSFLIDFVGNSLPRKEKELRVNELLELFESSGFDMTDGSGFMSPARWSDLAKGMGAAFKMGNVAKPMHFQQHIRPVAKTFDSLTDVHKALESGNYFKSPKFNNTENLIKQDGKYVLFLKQVKPVYLKYASIVLTDELIGISKDFEGNIESIKYPELYALRELMDKNSIGELVFKSAVKLGAPDNVRTIQEVLQNPDIEVPSNEILELDNRFYGFQFNPSTKPLKQVAHPTQLEYLVSLLDDNTPQAKNIYGAISFINNIKFNKLKAKVQKQGLNRVLSTLFTSKSGEKFQHLFSEGATINTPVVEKQAIIQLGAFIRKRVTSLNLKGGKLILQTAEGISAGSDLGAIISKHPSTEKLRYYRREDGTAVAEAIVPMDLLTPEQIRIVQNGGEVLLVGFRIPSTEIHSSVVIKVVDFYDSKTNVVVVSKFVGPIQGSDFDVDSLFVIVPETYGDSFISKDLNVDKDSPVGYAYENGKLVDKSVELDNQLSVLLTKETDTFRIEQIYKLQEKLASNIIFQNLIDVASASRNTQRMGSPISKEPFVRNGQVDNKDSGLLTLAKLGLIPYDKNSNNPFADKWDLNRLEDSKATHTSVSQGGQLVGVFANNVKVLSILSKSFSGRFNSIVGSNFKWEDSGNAVTLDSIRDHVIGSTQLTWQYLDGLVNLAIDNVKDQALSKFHINSKTANMTSLIFALGIPIQGFALITGTKLWRKVASDEFISVKEALDSSRKEFNYQSSKNDVILSEAKLRRLLELENNPLLEEKDKEELAQLNRELISFLQKLSNLGAFAKKLSEILTLLRDMPTEVDAVESIVNNLSTMLGITPEALLSIQTNSFNSVYSWINGIGDVLPRIEKKPQYFEVDIILQNHPHIFTAFRNAAYMYTLIKQNFHIHSPGISNIISVKPGFKLSKNPYTHLSEMRRAFSRFLFTNLFATELVDIEGDVIRLKRDTKEKKVTKEIIEYKGAKFWIEDFITKVEKLKKADIEAYSKYKDLGYTPNKFLSHLQIEWSPETKTRAIKVHTGTSFRNTDALRMEEGFLALRYFSFNENQEVVIHTDMSPASLQDRYNDVQRDFLTYNVLTSGMAYGTSNYSAYMPYDLYAEHEKKYLSKLIELSNSWGPQLESLILSFFAKVAISDPEKVGQPFAKNEKDVASEDAEKLPVSIVRNAESSLFDKGEDRSRTKGEYTTSDNKTIYYDVLYKVDDAYTIKPIGMDVRYDLEDEDPIEKEDTPEDTSFSTPSDVKLDKNTNQVIFPYFIRRRDTIYVRVFNDNTHVAYQAVGQSQNVDTSILPTFEDYGFKEYFDPYVRTYLSSSIDINTVERVYLDLDSFLNTDKKLIVVDRSNIYRIIRKAYTVNSYDTETKQYHLTPAVDPLSISFAEAEEDDDIEEITLPEVKTDQSFIDKVEREGSEWKDSPEMLDGEPTVRYYKKGNQTVVRLTEHLEGAFNKYFRRNPFTKRQETFYKEKADKLWENQDPSTTRIFPELSKEPIDKATYIALSKENSGKWAVIGTAGHKLLQAAVQSTSNAAQSMIEEAQSMLASIGLPPKHLNWVLKNSDAIFNKAGIDVNKDKVKGEVRIGSSIWGFGSTIDLLAEHADKTFSIVDYKFGKMFNRADSPFMMRFGRQLTDIFQSPRERAKLEVMFRALILKTEYPDIKFKNLIINWVPSKYDVENYIDHNRFVEIESYLNMIKQALEKEYRESATPQDTIYGKLQKLEHFHSIFDPNEYRSGYSETANNEAILEDGKTNAQLMRLYQEKLRLAIQYDLNPYVDPSLNNSKSSAKRLRLEEARELTQKILDLQRQGNNTEEWNKDISWMSLWLGSNRDISNPYIQVYSKLLDEAKNIRASKRFYIWEATYNKYVEPLLDDYKKRNGITFTGQTGRAALWTNIDPIDFWKWAYKHSPTGEQLSELNNTPEDWKEASKRFPFLLDSSGDINRNYINMIEFLMDSVEQFFINEKAYYTQDGVKVAMANKPATYRTVGGREQVISDLTLHLNPRPGKPARKWAYKRGWFPKVPVTLDEMGNPIARLADPRYWKNLHNKFFKTYVESEFTQEDNIEEAIPWRYLGNPEVDSSPYITMNLEESFSQFMKYHIMKEELTDVYAMGRGIIELLKMKQDPYRATDMRNTISYLEKALEMQVRGRKQQQFHGGFFGKDIPLIKNVSGNAERPDMVRIIRGLKSSASIPVMALKPFQGIANAVFTSLYILKESIKDSVVQKYGNSPFLNIDTNQTSFTPRELTEAWGDFWGMQADAMSGKLNQNKMWIMAKQFNYLPDNYDLFANRDNGRVQRGKIWDQSTLYMFHSVPEEALALVVMAAQLRKMKIKSTDSKNGRSLWSMYSVKEVNAPDGTAYHDLVWEDDYVRHYQLTTPTGVSPEYKEIKGLTVDEIRRMFYVYQRMQGNYKPDERVMLEYYVLGELFMQFKRYLPTLLKNYGGSRGTVQSYGYYKPKKGPDGKVLMENGKEVVEWVSRMVEGRYMTLLGLLLNGLSVRSHQAENLTWFGKLTTFIGLQNLESYNWKELPEAQRELLVDFTVTSSMYLGILAAYFALGGGGDADRDDPYLQFVTRVKNNFGQQWDFLEPLRDVTLNAWPTSLKVSWYRAQAITDMSTALFWYSVGDKDKALTTQGTLKGTNKFIKYWVPFGGSYYDAVRLIMGEPYVDEFTYRIVK